MRKHTLDILFMTALIALSFTPGLIGGAYALTEYLIQIMIAIYVLVLVLSAIRDAIIHALDARRRHKKKERVKKPKRRRHRLR
jgi:hypothetical protein